MTTSQKAYWLTLKDRLLLNDAVMVFKFLNDLVPKYLANIFVPRSHIHTRTTRSCNLLHIPRCRLSYGQRSFTYSGYKLWNFISNYLKAADCVNSFRRGLLQKLLFRLESNAEKLIMTTNRIIWLLFIGTIPEFIRSGKRTIQNCL